MTGFCLDAWPFTNAEVLLIPEPILAQVGLQSAADLLGKICVIEIRPLVAPMTTGSRAAGFRIGVTFQGKAGLILLDQIRKPDKSRLVKKRFHTTRHTCSNPALTKARDHKPIWDNLAL